MAVLLLAVVAGTTMTMATDLGYGLLVVAAALVGGAFGITITRLR